jgi:uncharacterized repeat protein (TIGR01451 family)
MKRKHGLALIAALVILALTASLALATTYNTIAVDGDMSDWAADEFMETDNGGDFYVTWDAANVYFGLANVNIDDDGVFFIYIDAIPGQGTTTGWNWNGTHTLPFDADFAIAADSGFNLGWLVWNTGTLAWDWTPYPGANYVGWSGNPNSEFQIFWTEMVSPDRIYVMALFQNQGDNGVTASWPTPNPANNAGSEIFTHHYHFPSLVAGQSPHDSVLADHILINELDAYAEWIELYNPTEAFVDIGDWQLVADYDDLNYTIPAGTTLAPGAYWTYNTSGDLNNGGDVINLYDAAAVLVDQVGYESRGGAPGSSTDVPTTARVPNGTDTDDDARDWNLTTIPSPLAANDVPTVLLGSSLIVNEIYPFPATGNDHFEVYNPTGSDYTISDWYASDGDDYVSLDLGGPVVVLAGGWVDLEEEVHWTGMDFAGYDVLYLFDPDGIRRDQLAYSGGPFIDDGESAQRICDGDGPNDGWVWDTSGGGETLFVLPTTLGSTNTPGPVDMEIVKDAPTSIAPGGVMEYVITYQALSPMPTTAFLITDFLPAEVEVLDIEADPPLTQMGTDPLWWDAGAACGLPSGMITITVQVTDTVEAGDEIVNEVWIDATGDLTPTNDSSVVTTTVTALNVTVLKTGSDDPLWPGDTVTYTISYVLDGNEDAVDVVITDTFPGDFVYSEHLAPPAFSCTAGADDLVCSAATVDVSGEIILTGTVSETPAEYVLTNTVEIAASNDGDPSDNDDEYLNHIVVPIQEIQYVPDPEADDASPYAGQHVWTEGVVTVDSDDLGGFRYFIQDPAGGPWSGLYIYHDGDRPPVQQGDWVLAHGQIMEYYGLTEFDLRDSADGQQYIISSTNPLPAPEILSTGEYTTSSPNTAEPYEGALIEFQAATVISDDLGYGEWLFDDGTGSARADDMSSALTYVPAMGDYYTYIRGLGYYGFDDYKIVPRYDADIYLGPYLTITKLSAPKEGVTLGSVVTFTIIMDNTGADDAVGVVMTDPLPVEVDFGGWVQQSGAIEANDTVTWTGDISAETQVQIIFTVTVGTDEDFYGREVTNTAYFDSENAGSGSDPTGFPIEGTEDYYIYLPIVLNNH